MVPGARPSSASKACAAGISLDLSAMSGEPLGSMSGEPLGSMSGEPLGSMSICASISAVSVANALSTCAAARSLNLSKPGEPLGSTLPRSVLPSRATLPCPGVVRAACSRAAWRRKAASTPAGSNPRRM